MTKQEAVDKLKAESYRIEPGQTFQAGRLEPRDAWGVARCFFAQFGENYPFEVTYIPDRLLEENLRGNLRSVVARTPAGDIIGYAALYRSSAWSPRVYESGQMVIHPEYRSTFAAWSLQELLEEVACGEGIDAIFGEAVTNHVITQRMTLMQGFKETGIEVGLLPPESYRNEQAPGDRGTVLLTFRCMRDEPRTVYLPERYADPLNYILSGCDLSRQVVPSSSKPPSGGTTDLRTQIFDFAQVARFNVASSGGDFEKVFDAAESQARQKGAQVLQAFINLAEPWSGAIAGALRRRGYFLGGFLPRWFDTDGLLMQKPASLPRFDSLQFYSQRARAILDFIRRDIAAVE